MPYRPSGRCSPAGALVMLACAIAGAAAVGGLYFLLTQFVDIPIVMPIVGGLAVGGMAVLAVRAGRCRNAGLALLAGALAGVLTYGTRLMLDSQQLRPQFVSLVARSVAVERKMPLREAQARVGRALTPWKTLRLFLLLQAHVGVGIGDMDAKSVTHVSGEKGSEVLRSGSHFTIQGPFYWLMLAVEAGLAALIAAVMAAAGTAAPFCESCHRWYRSRRLLRADPGQAANLASAAQARGWERLIRTPQGGTDQNYSELVLARCPKCAAATLAVKLAPASRKPHLHARVEAAVADYLQANAPPAVTPGRSVRVGR